MRKNVLIMAITIAVILIFFFVVKTMENISKLSQQVAEQKQEIHSLRIDAEGMEKAFLGLYKIVETQDPDARLYAEMALTNAYVDVFGRELKWSSGERAIWRMNIAPTFVETILDKDKQ